MKTLFDKTEIKGMTLKNRFVRSATWEGMCEPDGRPTEKLARFYKTLAQGKVGLIITGYTFVRPEGKELPGKMGIHRDNFSDSMKELTQAVHDEGGKICIQLVHAGGQTTTRSAGRQPFAPSAVKVEQFPEIPEEMTVKDIEEVVKEFSKSASRAKEYGFDAVQLHGAHGYLINQFLSPLTNLRNDGYGGSLDNRCRFLMEVFESVRSAVGDDFPVMIKLNGADNLEGGLTNEDAVYAAKLLSDNGIDSIEISGGTPASGSQSPARIKIKEPGQEGYNLDVALTIKNAVSCPVMVVGGFRSYDVSEKTVSVQDMDYISIARPFIREPDLVHRWQAGDRTPAKCISCNGCFSPGLKEGGIYCVVEKKEREKKEK